jgi:hypothetical protein
MAGFIAIGNNKYIGTVKLATGAADIQNGQFAEINWADATASTPTTNANIAYFVENVIDTVDEQQINDLDFVVVAGSYLRLKRLHAGEIFVTDQVDGTVNVDSIVDVGTLGKIKATSGSPNQTFRCIEKPTVWGKTVYKCIVL